MPGGSWPRLGRRPVATRSRFHTRVVVIKRQNATSTPGVSARLTSVEPNEKATTTATTATHPSVFVLGRWREDFTTGRFAVQIGFEVDPLHVGNLGPQRALRFVDRVRPIWPR